MISQGYGPKPLTKRTATFELVAAGFFWGFGFVATQWALRIFTPAQTLVLRFIIAFLIGETIRSLFFKSKSMDSFRDLLKASAVAGFLLGSCLLLQTTGLIFTSATNSGFITCLYILLVPFLGALIFRHRIVKGLWLYALSALVGAFLMMGGKFGTWNKGDLLTLACSVFAALHILYIGYATEKIHDGFKLNNFQNLMAMILLLPALLLPNQQATSLTFFTANWNERLLPLFGLFMIAVGGSTFAFFLQIRAQKILSANEASMLFLLESPFAMICGAIFIGDHITTQKIVGAILILLAAVLTLKSDSKPTESKPT